MEGIAPLVAAGLAVHHLHARSKRPVGEGWQNAPVATLDELTATYRNAYNVGVRLGEPSAVAAGYLHALDVDIRNPDLADDAWEALRNLFDEQVDIDSLPCVRSGSGGESRHLYFISDQAFRSKRLVVSDGKHRGADGKWHLDWEVELFGTGKQVALPQSIHPDTGKPYQWVRPFNLDGVDFGLPIAPVIPSELLAELTEAITGEYAYEAVEPLTFKAGQLEAELNEIPVSDLHYDDWIRVGQALHHQFGGSQAGFDLWLKHTQRSTKFTGERQVREMRRVKWPSFGKYRGRPVTMGTIRQWVLDARHERTLSMFDEVDAFDEPAASDDDLDLLGEPAPRGDLSDDDLLGGAPAPADDIDAIGTPGNETRRLEWTSLLDLTEKGGFKPTLHNIELIVKNDPRLIGLPQLNEFTQETVQRINPGVRGPRRPNEAKATRQLTGRIWEVNDTRNGEIWSSARDYAIRSIIEAPKTQGGYELKLTDRDLKAATVLAAWENTFHPVREYLNGLTWDGVPRCETLFIDYMGAEDNSYSRAVARLMLTAAIMRVFEPGCKWDFAVILEGLQGRGKSTFIRILGKDWFAELDGDFHDGKEMVEKMQGAWIMEIPELSSFNRSDVRSIKAFISRQTDKVRLAYEARATEFPRQCILIGSTNDSEYLRDDTGGRRFFPMECRVDMIDVTALRSNVDQIWAEAHAIYRQMRLAQPEGDLPLYLTDDASAIEAARLQETRRVESSDDAQIGEITAWLDRPVSTGGFDDDVEGGYRNITCLLEVWLGLGRDRNAYQGQNQQSFGRAFARVKGWRATGKFHNFHAPVGRQRFYERVGSLGIHEPVSRTLCKPD